MSKWQGAHTPADGSVGLTVRLTPEEKDRLEQLRRAKGLTSKAQVIRYALDVMEALATPGEFILGGPEGVRRQWAEHEDLVRAVQRKWGGRRAGCRCRPVRRGPGLRLRRCGRS